MIRALALSLALGLQAQAALAVAPDTSIRPTARPGFGPVAAPVRIRVHFNPDFRPTARPGTAPALVATPSNGIYFVPLRRGSDGVRPVARPGSGWVSPSPVRVITAPGIMMAGPAVIRPTARPEGGSTARVTQTAAIATQPRITGTGRTGRICGKRSIRGEKLPPIVGQINGCGIRNPVKVTEVAGVSLSRGAVVDCDTAKALDTWVEKGAKPSIGRLGGGVETD